MGWDINRVLLVGRLSSDVDLRYTPGGTAVAKFSLAVGGKPKPDGSDTVYFFNIVVWGKSGENCSNHISKGQQVCLEGRLEQRSWQAQDGSKRSTVEIVADRVEFLSKPKDGNNQGKQQKGYTMQEMQNEEDGYYDETGFNQNPIDPGF